jgi:hydrogenase nickel incorporation protein HypA/HybF
MHEYSITCAIISILEKTAKEKTLKKISRVNLEINPAASLEPESIKFYFEFLTREKALLKGAKLKFTKIRTSLKCSSCQKEFFTTDFPPKCPACGKLNLGFDAGLAMADDIKVISLVAD